MSHKLLLPFLFILFTTACGGGGSNNNNNSTEPEQETRSFKMGFTPWQYAATFDAQNVTYSRILQHGDIVKHHLMSGLPWQEAFDQTAYPTFVEAEITGRLTQTGSSDVFLAIDSLNAGRDAKPDYWRDAANEPLDPPWSTRTWSSPEVIQAYVNFALDMIQRFNPSHFEYGTEISELILNDSAGYTDYLVFAESVYQQIKAVHPELKLVISIALKDPASTEAADIADRIDEIMPFTDVVGVSVYPYGFYNNGDNGNPENLSIDWLSQVINLADGKPIVISETGWIAEDLEIPSFGYSATSDEDKQDLYATMLLEEAEELNAELVIWWTITDFDTLWVDTLASDPVAKIWKDIGFYDENQQPRKIIQTWENWLERPLEQ